MKRTKTINVIFAPRVWGLGGASVRRAAMTLLVMMLTTMTAWAQLSNLTYNSAGRFYEIWSAADLQAMANYYNGLIGGDGKVFKMMQDIDLAGVNTSFLPIASANSESLFNDVFDGNDHKITGLSLVREGGKTYYGLFQQLGSSATVKNLTLVDCDVRYTGGINGTSVGAIAGRNRGTIQNCTVIGTVSNHDNEHCVGAIVGENISPGRVENCNAVAGQPVTGVLYSTSTPGTESGNHLYYRLLTTSAVSLTTTPAATTVAGTACYAANTALALTVTPNDGTQMLTDVSFTGTTATKTAYGQYTLTMPARDVSVTAALAAKISVSATGGTVTPNTYSPAVGSQVTLTLAPNTGYTFTTIAATAGGTALTLNGSGLTRTFTMPDKPVSITATFSAVSYTVSGLGSKTGGRISGPGTAHYGDEVTLTAAPATGYSLQTLSVTTAGNQNVALSGSGNTRTFTMPAENVTVSATFALAQLTVHVTAYNCTATATPNPATMGQTVTVSITPDAGATLQSVTVRDAGWNHLTVSGSGQTRTFTMSAADAYVTVACSSSGQLAGKGTQDEPYLIFNEADLRLLSSLSKTTTFWGTNFRLERDITMSDTPMLPIGDSSNGQFDGHFDGNGHTISNLHISGKVADFVALFGINYGSVSNLTLASCAITGNESGTFYIGAIVGYNRGTVSNCHVNSGTISTTAATNVGGIVGDNNGGTVIGCTNGATVSRTTSTVRTQVGGIVGVFSGGTVKDCTNTGSVSISGAGASDYPLSKCGGIAGYLYSGILSGCANTGSVSVTGSNATNNAGGVAGSIENRDAAICIGNTNGGAVSAANGITNNAGGIVGFYYYSSYILKNNYYFGACTAKGSGGYVSSGNAPQSDVTANYGAVPGYAITKPAEVTLSSIEGYADVAHPAYAASGETLTFTVTVPEGYTTTVKYNDGSDHALTATNGVYSFTMPAKAVTITVNFAPDPAHFSQSGTTYTIRTAAGWDVFCDALQDNDTYNRFSGKTVKLGDDISVTRMADGQPFTGTFDGDGHTLTLNYGTADAPVNEQFVAPFVATSADGEHQPVFRNLTIDGTIYDSYSGSEAHNVGGLIGHLYGDVTIEHCTSNLAITSVGGAGGFVGLCEHTAMFTDCKSSVVITSPGGNNSGFVSWSRASGHAISFDGCVFNGKLLQQNGAGGSNGCFIGWTGSNKTVTITNSLCAPAATTTGETMASDNSATFARGWNATTTATNSYYTTTFGTVQGKQRRSIAAGANVTVEHAGVAKAYDVSGITAYKATEASGDSDPFIAGLLYNNNVLYAGSGDEVSLTLGNTAGEAPAGCQYAYTVSGGTLSGTANPYTLTMPDADVTVSATLLTPITYIDENGDEQTLQPGDYTLLTGDEPVTVDEDWGNYVSLAGGTYVVNSDVNYPCKVEMTGNVTLILADGANMTIQPTQGEYAYGIQGWTFNVTIYGQENNTGTLTVSSYIKEEDVDAIFVSNLTVNGGIITTYGTISAKFTLNRGAVTVNKDTNGKAYVSGIPTINGGTLTINGGDAPDSDNGLKGSDVYINGGTVTVTGDKYGIYATDGVYITGGTVNATATATTGDASQGIYSKYCEMSDGTVTATGQQYGIYAKSSFKFSGGQLTANVAEGSEWADSYGIYYTGRKKLYYSHASDFIKASSYYGGAGFVFDSNANNPVGYVWVNESGTELSGLHQNSDADFNDIFAAINGQKLTPKLCTVTLPDGVTASGDGVTTVGDEVKAAVVLPVTLTVETEPTREGYTFAGPGVTDADDNSVDVSEGVFTMPNSDVTVSPTWTPIDYTIDYELNGGTVATPNPTTYNIESAEITLVNPTREGLEFNGWTGTGLDGPTMTVKIATGSTEYRKYTATWKAAMADGSAYDRTSDLEVDVATYTKTLGAARTGKFQAWLVPFDHAITQDDADKFTFYKINMIANAPNPETEASDEMWVFLKKMSLGDVLHANMPYVFKPKEDLENYAFTTPNATLKAKNDDVIAKSETLEDVYSFYATYENTTATDADPFYYVGIDGSLSLGTTVTVGPLRWIIRKESKFGAPTTYARRMYFFDGETTNISPAEIAEMAEIAGAWYTLDGRKLDAKPTTKGVYVRNGKKIVVK